MSVVLNTVLCKVSELSTLTYSSYVLNTFGRLFSCQGHCDLYLKKKNTWHLPGNSLFLPFQQYAVNLILWRLLAALYKHKLVFINWCNISAHGTRRSIQGSAYSFKGNRENWDNSEQVLQQVCFLSPRCCSKVPWKIHGVVTANILREHQCKLYQFI